MKTEILEHDIRWWVESNHFTNEDFESEQIENLIKQGYSSGSLSLSKLHGDTEIESSGWWEIVNWQNIALELYNAKTVDEIIKAKLKFDKYWE